MNMNISSGRGEYEVKFLSTLDELLHEISTRKYSAVIYDQTLQSKNIINISKLSTVPSFALPANESTKEFKDIAKVLEWMSTLGLNRESELLAIGGGVIQDVATFASAVFHRGINWTYVPTTLLAQSDSCIGGKCGINLKDSKNQVGLVYPPNDIYIVDQFLDSLSPRDITSGLGEILKMSLTGEGQFWDLMKKFLTSKDVSRQELIKRSLIAKKIIIEKDEYEDDLRRVLNYGHTIGHAIESVSNYQIPHGIAVLLGMKVIHRLGVMWGITTENLANEVDSFINLVLREQELNLELDSKSIFNKVKHDKKARNNNMNFVVLKEPGQLQVISRPIDQVLEAEIADAFSQL
jgi:3-dehydroquinate synthase